MRTSPITRTLAGLKQVHGTQKAYVLNVIFIASLTGSHSQENNNQITILCQDLTVGNYMDCYYGMHKIIVFLLLWVS